VHVHCVPGFLKTNDFFLFYKNNDFQKNTRMGVKTSR